MVLGHLNDVRCHVRAATIVLAACAVAACSMASSTQILETADSRCSSTVGGYYLSSSVLEIQIVRGAKDARPQLNPIQVLPKADRARGYCLDFLASGTSSDTFVVQRDEVEGLLLKVTSRAEDKSQEIADNLIQAVFKGLTVGGAGVFRSGELPPETQSAFKGHYDPFNRAQTALINDSIKDLGYCLILDYREVGSAPGQISSYCDNPFRYAPRERALVAAAEHAGTGGFVSYTKGILYRPRLPYNLYLFRNSRKDLRLPGDWRLWQSETVYLENQSPTLVVGVDRTYFAERKTTLIFNYGVLQDVLITKTSELAGAAQIPLTIANNIAALPGNIVQLRIDQTTKREELIRAQDSLLQAERKLASDRKGLMDLQRASDPPPRRPEDAPNRDLPAEKISGAASRTNQCQMKIDQCVKDGIHPATCEQQCR